MHNGRGGRAQFGRFACTMRAVWLLSRRRRIQLFLWSYFGDFKWSRNGDFYRLLTSECYLRFLALFEFISFNMLLPGFECSFQKKEQPPRQIFCRGGKLSRSIRLLLRNV